MRGLTLVLSLVLAGCTTVPQREPQVHAQAGVAFDARGEIAVGVERDAGLSMCGRLHRRNGRAAGEG